MNTLKQKLNRANSILAKLRYSVTADVLIRDMHVKFGDKFRVKHLI